MPHVAFLHERFLFRHGHDRTMLLHGRELVRRGWEVSFIAFAADRAVIEAIGARAVVLPSGADSYDSLDGFACDFLAERWFDLFVDGAPDVVVNGGWPFYAFNARAERLNAAAVVFDAGATPLKGAALDGLPVQLKLRALRRAHLPQARRSVSVSDFITTSQTQLDAPLVPNTVVLNAVDHIMQPLWKGDSGEAAMRRLLASARVGAPNGERKVLLHLGRWEGGYKNKEGALEVLRRVRTRCDAVMVVLAEADPTVSADLAPYVVFAGFPGDGGLRALMTEADAGVSASLWEGFNLALAEMHYLGRPAYALHLGAHAEAAIDLTYLRPTLDDLAEAVACELEGSGATVTPEALAAYRTRMAWSRAAAELESVLYAALVEKRAETPAWALALDVTNAARDPANSGVVRVTRQLSRALQPYIRTLFLAWDDAKGRYRTLSREEAARLGSFGGPQVQGEDVPRALGRALAEDGLTLAQLAWLAPETGLQARGAAVADWAARERLVYTAVLHDVIPLSHPQFCAPEIVAAFPIYSNFLRGSARLLANSKTTAQAWIEHSGLGPELLVEPLASDFGPRHPPKAFGPVDPVRILCVSTFEPRKNHATLLEAFVRAKPLTRGRRLELHLVGGGYAGDGGAFDRVRTAADADPDIRLHGRIDDAALDALYAQADFTVYPSVWEGYGLPIAESRHHARPFVCSGDGSMGELAAEGGGLTCDIADPDALAFALARLATDDALRHRLARVCALTPGRSWDDYARACLDHATLGRPPLEVLAPREPHARPPRQLPVPGDDMDWDSLLYPGKPTNAWQMSDSERMALTGLLARRRPKTYLEIGTYFGGSALLASEFADWVITLDIDPEAGTRFEKPENVTFISGRSQEVLPGLLEDLLARDLYPEFVLIDGDHSAEGVRRDMEIFLKIRPPSPLVVVFHDSFNPVCRSGIRTAPWADCPYVSRLDLDFVPGRLVEIAGDPFGGEMWGGLAVAVLTPEPQPHPFLTATAEAAFQRTLPQSAHAQAA